MNENYSQLAQAIQNGDKKAAERFYSLTCKQAYLTAMSIVTDQSDAPKLVKDVYVGFFSNIGALKNPNELELEFYKELDSKAKQYLDGKKPGLFSASAAGSANAWADNKNTVTTAVAPDAAAAGMNTIYALPEDQKLALIMYYSQNMTTAQIASVLEIDENEVKGRLATALGSIEALAAQAGTNSASLSYMALEGAQSSITAPTGQFSEIMQAIAAAPAQSAPAQPSPAQPAPEQNFVSPFSTAGSQSATSASSQTSNQPVSNTDVKTGMSLGAKIALIAAGVVAVAIIVTIILAFTVCSDNSGTDDRLTPAETTPVYSSSLEPETEPETKPETESTASSGAIFDESYALPEDYQVEGGSFDKTRGYIPAFDADEQNTIAFIENLPQIKALIDDDYAYIRKEVTQDPNSKTRNIYNYYDGDLSVFIDTDSLYSEMPTSIRLMMYGELGENRSIAQSILEQIKLDEQIINALLYSDMSDYPSFDAKNGTGSYSLSNEISEDTMNISINFYPDVSSEGDVQVPAKYYDAELEKEVESNSLFNNPDIDFSKDLFNEGVYDIGPSWDKDHSYSTYDIGVTRDQNNEVLEKQYNISASLTTDSIDDEIVYSESLNLYYDESDYDDPNVWLTMTYNYNDIDNTYRTEIGKLALAQLKKFDKDVKLTAEDLTLSDDESEKEVEFETSFGDEKGIIEISLTPSSTGAVTTADSSAQNNNGSISYTISWTYDD